MLRLIAGRDWARQIGLRRPGAWQVVLAILGFPALPILASGVYLLARDHVPGIRDLPSFLLAQLITLTWAWATVRFAVGKDWSQRLAGQPPLMQFALTTVGLATVLVVGLLVFRAAVSQLPRIPYDGPPLMEAMVEKFRHWPWWLAVLVIGVGPGLSEELWCRGFLGRGLVGRYGVMLGVVLTSYLFGLIHGEPHQGTMAVLMGLALHFSYLMTRSLWVPILLHTLNNSLSVVATKLSPELAKIDSQPEAIPGVLYAAAGLLLLAAGWALYRCRTWIVSFEEKGRGWQPPLAGVAHPPAESGAWLERPGPGWLGAAVVAAAFALFAAVFYLIEIGRL
jgi:membrane protease YdiL (CAAX protease family)